MLSKMMKVKKVIEEKNKQLEAGEIQQIIIPRHSRIISKTTIITIMISILTKEEEEDKDKVIILEVAIKAKEEEEVATIISSKTSTLTARITISKNAK